MLRRWVGFREDVALFKARMKRIDRLEAENAYFQGEAEPARDARDLQGV